MNAARVAPRAVGILEDSCLEKLIICGSSESTALSGLNCHFPKSSARSCHLGELVLERHDLFVGSEQPRGEVHRHSLTTSIQSVPRVRRFSSTAVRSSDGFFAASDGVGVPGAGFAPAFVAMRISSWRFSKLSRSSSLASPLL